MRFLTTAPGHLGENDWFGDFGLLSVFRRRSDDTPPNVMADDPHDLLRFVSAQAGVYETALEELQRGAKRSHWMWFVFPQVAGLGSSHMAQRYAIASRAEAEAYLAHPVLGPRLRECVEALLAQEDGKTAREIMGTPDDLKLRSSLTLFAEVGGAGEPFRKALGKYFSGGKDERTVEFLGKE